MANDKVQQTLDNLLNGVRDFFTSDKLKEYLNVMSRFHNYSTNNCILIGMQHPGATHVAGFKKWNEFNRYVKKGESGIQILAPYTRTIDVETDKTDAHGNVIYEKQTKVYFKVAYVYDISQTDGEPLPELITELSGDVNNYDSLFNAIKATSGYDIVISPLDDKKGYCDYVNRIICINEGMSQLQTIKTALHELSHERLHTGDKEKRTNQREVEAEAVAYVVCSHFGLDTSDYSFGYVASWAGQEDEEILKSCIDTIKHESASIINDIENELEKQKTLNNVSVSEIEKKILGEVNEKLINTGINAEAVGMHIYNVKSDMQQHNIHVISPYYSYEALFTVSNITSDKLNELLHPGQQYDYLDYYLTENGAEVSVNPLSEKDTINFIYEMDTGELTPVSNDNIKSISTLVEVEGEASEDEVFTALSAGNDNLSIFGIDVELNPIKEDLNLVAEPYTERLEKYEDLGYDSRWPMVSVSYSNIKNVPIHNMNINEAVQYVNKLDDKVFENPNAYMKIKISYVYEDWNYEHVQDIDYSHGRINFIDYLNLPPNVISHLKAHSSIIDMCNMARNYAPDTSYGQKFADDILEWAEYCRMELNHNSKEPVIPKPPVINEMYKADNNIDWRLER